MVGGGCEWLAVVGGGCEWLAVVGSLLWFMVKGEVLRASWKVRKIFLNLSETLPLTPSNTSISTPHNAT